MANNVKIEYTKTYSTEANAEKAVAKLLGDDHAKKDSSLRYMINPVIVEGKIRYGVLFIGSSAVQAGIHFHFNLVG